MAREEDANWLAEEPEEVEDCGFPAQRPPEEQQRSVNVKLKGATLSGTKRKREGKQAARASRSKKVPELSDEEAQKLADEQGVHLLVTGSKSGFFGVYAKGGRFHASVRRLPEGGVAGPKGGGTVLVCLGWFASRKAAALLIARTPEGQAAAVAVASAGRLSNGGTGAQAPRWDAGMCGASQREEREEAKEARLREEGPKRKRRGSEEAKEAREEAKEAKEARLREAKEAKEEAEASKAQRQLAFCKAQEQAAASKEEKRLRREARKAQRERRAAAVTRARLHVMPGGEVRLELRPQKRKLSAEEKRLRREAREDAERAIEQAVMEQKDGGRLKKKTRDTLHGFNDVTNALRAKALTLLSRDRAAQILAVTACKRSHVLGVPQLAALGAPPLSRASLPRRAWRRAEARKPWLKLPMLPTGAVRGGGKGRRRGGAPRGASPVSSQAVRRPHSVLRPELLPAHRDYDADTQEAACSRAWESCLRLSQRWPRLCTERRVELGRSDCARSPC